MKVSEIPTSFVRISSTQWSDPFSFKMYFIDPTDSTALVSRDWNQKEHDDAARVETNKQQNTVVLSNVTKDAIQLLIDGIGPATKIDDPNNPGTKIPNPALTPGPTSLNAIIADTKANINANPSAYITFLARALRRVDKAVIADNKLRQGLVADANIGTE